jgi:4'-phosphopantetheinyl transferase
LVACAVGIAAEIGIDIESIGAGVPFELAETYFADDERAWLRSRPRGDQAAAFVTLWTWKEAFVKATGRGPAEDLRGVCFALGPTAITLDTDAFGPPEDWWFCTPTIGGTHRLALASRGRPAQLRMNAMNRSGILRMSSRRPG